MPEVIILIGPPGSGKTAIGHELSSRFGYRYRDYEADMVEKYGPLETFVNHKNRAVAEVHASIISAIAESGPPVVIETTALSERDFVDGLVRDHRSFTVGLKVSLPAALERIEGRPRGSNLSNGAGTNQRIWERFEEVHGTRKFDIEIDTDVVRVSEAAVMIDEAVSKSAC